MSNAASEDLSLADVSAILSAIPKDAMLDSPDEDMFWYHLPVRTAGQLGEVVECMRRHPDIEWSCSEMNLYVAYDDNKNIKYVAFRGQYTEADGVNVTLSQPATLEFDDAGGRELLVADVYRYVITRTTDGPRVMCEELDVLVFDKNDDRIYNWEGRPDIEMKVSDLFEQVLPSDAERDTFAAKICAAMQSESLQLTARQNVDWGALIRSGASFG